MATQIHFPAGLLHWGGDRAGGVRRLFDETSGRPLTQAVRTPLLGRLEDWARRIGEGDGLAPSIVMLVGAPGNGKTEAVDQVIGWLDRELRASGRLVDGLRDRLTPVDAQTSVPRVASVTLGAGNLGKTRVTVSVVQDASVEDGTRQPRAQLLMGELEEVLTSNHEEHRHIYVVCINRGVLDEALIESQGTELKSLLEEIVQAVGVQATTVSCWPLAKSPQVAVWPMDIDSLVQGNQSADKSPFMEMLDIATDPEKWGEFGTCAGQEWCPFCTNRRELSQTDSRDSLIYILRWYEHASGKRLTFRDCFSLISSLLAGHPRTASDEAINPCEWASRKRREDAMRESNPTADASLAIFELAGALYQHQLFGAWGDGPPLSGSLIASKLAVACEDAGIQNHPTIMGLIAVIRRGRAYRVVSTISALTDPICQILDPAVSDPEATFELGLAKTISVSEIDERFSHSVSNGIEFVRHLESLSFLELALLTRLAELDSDLDGTRFRSSPRKARAAGEIQLNLRQFAARWVKRSFGALTAVVRDLQFFLEFENLILRPQSANTSVSERFHFINKLKTLFGADGFINIDVNTTFGQPSSGSGTRVEVRAQMPTITELPEPYAIARPGSPIQHLQIGNGGPVIPLTFDVFRAVTLLEKGLDLGSLPSDMRSTVDALLSRLSGTMVRSKHGGVDTQLIVGDRRFQLVGDKFIEI